MESIAKILEFVGKYAWGVAIVAAFVLFVPDDAAQQIGVLAIRNDFKGLWWLVLVLCTAIWLGAAFQYLDKRFLDGWLKDRALRRAKDRESREFSDALSLRLNSLDPRERDWIRYCLINNTQSLSSYQTHPTAQSLVHKGILAEGSGHMMDLPFHFPDNVWKYLLSHRSDFIADGAEHDSRLRAQLEDFRRSLEV